MRFPVRAARAAPRRRRATATAGALGLTRVPRRSAGFTETTQLDILLSEYAELSVEGSTAIHVTGEPPPRSRQALLPAADACAAARRLLHA